jgi:hypothetical protein
VGWLADFTLYLLAFVGLWHIIGLPPVMEWFRRPKRSL